LAHARRGHRHPVLLLLHLGRHADLHRQSPRIAVDVRRSCALVSPLDKLLALISSIPQSWTRSTTESSASSPQTEGSRSRRSARRSASAPTAPPTGCGGSSATA